MVIAIDASKVDRRPIAPACYVYTISKCLLNSTRGTRDIVLGYGNPVLAREDGQSVDGVRDPVGLALVTEVRIQTGNGLLAKQWVRIEQPLRNEGR